MVEAHNPPMLSPRKRKAQKPLDSGFFGVRDTPKAPSSLSAIPSSSPAFATPAHTLRPFNPPKATAILPILLPPATLRPLAFRTFTKKHSLTLTSTALQELATFVGRHCGSGWREEGLAERVLEEVAKSWKGCNGGVIIDGSSSVLKDILKTLEGNMSGGKIVTGASSSSSSSSRGLGLLSRQNSLLLDPLRESDHSTTTRLGLRPSAALQRDDSQSSIGLSSLAVDDEPDDDGLNDHRRWLKIVSAYEQPRMFYNVAKKHFERETSKPSILPPASHKTTLFRNRYNVVHQRLLRNEAFQTSTVATTKERASLSRSASSLSSQQSYKITPVANLLGRHGTHHMLLGMLVVMPAGSLAISDPTGTIVLDLSQAVAIPEDSAWFTPGMIVLVDGMYEEEEEHLGQGGLSGGTGVGGTVGGRFQGFFVGQPPCEKRRVTLGVSGPDGGVAGATAGGGGRGGGHSGEHTIGGGFGWIDFLGVGSERAVGSRMRRLERRILRQHLRLQQQQRQSTAAEPDPSTSLTAAAVRGGGRGRIVILGEVNLDQPRALQALRKVLATYASEPADDGLGGGNDYGNKNNNPHHHPSTPMAFVLAGSFTSQAVMARNGGGGTASSAGGGGGGGGGGSIEYKEYFDSLASTLSDFPHLLRESTFVFVPGDNDGWASAFSAGASVPLPRRPVPDLFTSRVRRAFVAANAAGAEGGGGGAAAAGTGEAVFTSNPSRVSVFGPSHEVVLFRDDMSARMRRSAVRLKGSLSPPAPSSSSSAAAKDDDVVMSGALPDHPDTEAAGGSSNAMDVDPGLAGAGAAPAKDQEEGDNGAAAAAAEASLLPQDVRAARKLVKTVLDQGYLAPFRTAIRPVHWDHASSLHLYPLPTAIALVDATAPPFCVSYEGCHVMNPGALLVAGRRGVARWVEYEVGRGGVLRECLF